MNKYLYLVFVIQVFHYAEPAKKSILSHPGPPGHGGNPKNKKGVEIPLNPRCKAIKCPPITAPICTEMEYKIFGEPRKNYVIMVNKCEMNYVNCHQGIGAKEVPMENCEGHSKRKTKHSVGQFQKFKVGERAPKRIARNKKPRIFRPVRDKYYKLNGKSTIKLRPKRDVTDTMLLDPKLNARRVDPIIPAHKPKAPIKSRKPKAGSYKVMASAQKLKLKDLITENELMDLESGLLTKLGHNNNNASQQAINNVKKMVNKNNKKPKSNNKLPKLTKDETFGDVLGVLSGEFSDDTGGPKVVTMRQTLKKDGYKILSKPQAKLKDLISKDELINLLGDGLDKLNKQGNQFKNRDKKTILIDSSKKSPVAGNNLMNNSKRDNSPKKTLLKKRMKNFAKKWTKKLSKKRVRTDNSSKKKLAKNLTTAKKVLNRNVPTQKPIDLKPVLREFNGESTEADSSEAARYANHRFRHGLAPGWEPRTYGWTTYLLGETVDIKKKRAGRDDEEDTKTQHRSSGKKGKKKDKRYTFLSAKVNGEVKTVWISKKDYYKLRRLIKGLTPEEEIFKANYFKKREEFRDKPLPLLLNPGSQKLNGKVQELQAVAVEKVDDNRYKAVLIDNKAFKKFRTGEANSIDTLGTPEGVVELQDLPSTTKDTRRSFIYLREKSGKMGKKTLKEISKFFIVGFPNEAVFLSPGEMPDMAPIESNDEYDANYDDGDDNPDQEAYEIEDDGIPDLYAQFDEEKTLQDDVDLKEHMKSCPTKCPIRIQMVCARCGDKIYRTFQSVCHMRMFHCKNPNERLQLVAREPCALSTPFLRDMRVPDGRLTEPNDDDVVLRYVKCKNDIAVYGQSNDPRCDLGGEYYNFIYPSSENLPNHNEDTNIKPDGDPDNDPDHDPNTGDNGEENEPDNKVYDSANGNEPTVNEFYPGSGDGDPNEDSNPNDFGGASNSDVSADDDAGGDDYAEGDLSGNDKETVAKLKSAANRYQIFK